MKGRGRLRAVCYLIAGGLGVLQHFLNDLVTVPGVLRFLVATDESVFEHLKLYFFPVMIVTLVEYYARRQDRRKHQNPQTGENRNVQEFMSEREPRKAQEYPKERVSLAERIGNRATAVLIVIVMQIIFFYAYTALIPPNPVIDIGGYFVFLALIFIVSDRLERNEQLKAIYGEAFLRKSGLAAFAAVLVFLIVFTYIKPELPLFIDGSQTVL